jgi:uncharacterized protein (TIGR03435 family)
MKTQTLASILRLAVAACVAATAVVAAEPVTFEVASVKPAAPPTGHGVMTTYSGGPGTRDPGTIVVSNYSLADLIRQAYGIKPYQLSAPAWLASARFDIVAKPPEGATKEQVPAMWQALLAERFQLTTHNESKELPMYALVIAKSGSKLKETAKDDPTAPSTKGGIPAGPGNGGGSAQIGLSGAGRDGAPRPNSSVHKMSGGGITVSRLADMLAGQLDRPVVDMTELTGKYDFALAYSDSLKPSDPLSESAAEPPSAPSIFSAVEQQLGLKLEARKGAVSILVIDHAEKVPSGN